MQNIRIIKSACRMCHGGCQVLVHMEGERVVKITGNHPENPTSRGYICPKGVASAELLYHPDRILKPLHSRKTIMTTRSAGGMHSALIRRLYWQRLRAR